MDIGFILLAVALIGLVIFIVAQPFLEHPAQHERAAQPTDQLTAERDSLLGALRDLDFDHATGKITDDEYAAQRAQWVARGAEVLRQLDALGAPSTAAGDEVETEIERAIAARRKAAGQPSAPPAAATAACPTCGAVARAGDRFCASCGGALVRTCAQCAAPLTVADRFCGNCGAPVAAEAQS